jgi:hypothetical protein
MTPQEASFRLWWAQHYATQALFNHNEEVGQAIFQEIWDIAIQEAAAVAVDVNPFVAERVRQLCN